MNDNHIRCFLEVEREKSFTRAAINLHQTQPGISRNIAALERELETKLFLREPHKPPMLTETGKIYYQAFSQCGRILQEARLQCSKINRDKNLQLRFGYAFGWSTSFFLPDMLDTLKRTFPSMNIELVCHGPNTLYSLLESDDLDLALTIHSPFVHGNQIVEAFICDLPRVILYSDKLTERIGEIKHPEDIRGIPIFLPIDEVQGKYTELVRTYLDQFDFAPVFRTVSNINTAVSIVETGDGVMLFDAWAQHLFMPQYHSIPIGSCHQIVLAARKECASDKVISTIRKALIKTLRT